MDLLKTKSALVGLTGTLIGLGFYLSGNPEAPPLEELVREIGSVLTTLLGVGLVTLRHALLKGGAVGVISTPKLEPGVSIVPTVTKAGMVAGMSVMLLSGCALLQSPDAAGVSRLDHEKVAYTAQVAATAGLQALTSAGRLGEITPAEAKPVAYQLYYAGTKAGEAVEIAARIADEPEAEEQFWAALQESQRVLGLVAQNPAVSSLGIFPTSQ